jgi:hypothetical protein
MTSPERYYGAITTKDMNRLLKFYTLVFRLKVLLPKGLGPNFPIGRVLAIPPLMPERKPVALNINEGFYHFYFQVDEVDGRPSVYWRADGGLHRESTSGRKMGKQS